MILKKVFSVLLIVFLLPNCADYYDVPDIDDDLDFSEFKRIVVNISCGNGFPTNADADLTGFGISQSSGCADPAINYLTWSGTSYSESFSDECEISSYTFKTDYQISGRVSSTFDELIEFKGTYIFNYYYGPDNYNEYTYELDLSNIALTPSPSEGAPTSWGTTLVGGANIENYVDKIFWRNRAVGNGNTSDRLLDPIPWDDETIILKVTFYNF